MDAIRHYARDRIVLLITHHAENIQDSDELWIMDNGRLRTDVSPGFPVHSDAENSGLLEVADGCGTS
jgi:ABC-type transport system involved in cytochrome bd biosynthesis fused ATPase/permease subunit